MFCTDITQPELLQALDKFLPRRVLVLFVLTVFFATARPFFNLLIFPCGAGISTVPGSGFGQEEGTFHLRTTILPREEVMQDFNNKFKKFHEEFMAQYK